MYVVKISRGDLTYCFPVENKIGRLVVSILERLMSKTVLDFTGMLYVRHPFEMGGAYFSFTLLSTPVVCLYICSRYLDYVSDEEGKIFFARSSALPFCAQHFHLYNPSQFKSNTALLLVPSTVKAEIGGSFTP